ncbi:MAG: anti-anti-sigma factor [Deltaproteobacteria bacterium RIFOXYD12_FULL_50_9]|nr:MAG: anti-anti-sigma factor [Deltaproteobacteria bacterium RIFOXYD12_FULL_50_9]
MEIKVSQMGSRTRFEVLGDIDERGAEILKSHFKQLSITAVKELVIDLAQVGHIGSSGIGKLLLFYKNLGINGGTISIVNASEPIFQLLTELKLNAIFSISKK